MTVNERKGRDHATVPLESPNVPRISFWGHSLLTSFVEDVGLSRTGSKS